ncbi:acylphosphatase [Brachybacterium sp. AOP25-B2-12]|uniref:acylphosphatase n=1 Tax=Brachybacterium sp. AOP25-B2-12 TaxID=3457710 RepID=UPI0040334209
MPPSSACTAPCATFLDGTVEAVVEGEPEHVEAMLDWLRDGPPSARVEGIDVREDDPTGRTGFRVLG